MKYLAVILFLISSAALAKGGQLRYEQVNKVSVSPNHTCVITGEAVKCWGRNDFGQIDVPALKHPTFVSAGEFHSCAIHDDGVKCWGKNEYGESDVPPLIKPTLLGAGDGFTCATDQSGIKCWGKSPLPQYVEGVKSVATGENHICVLDKSGVRCWGRNDFHQLEVPALDHPRFIASAARHTCALDNSGVKCWGSNIWNQLNIPPLKNPSQLSVGLYHNCVIDDEGVKCWGANDYKQSVIPVLHNPKIVTAGGRFTCALDDDGVKCWGAAFDGVLEVPPLRNVKELAAGVDQVCAIDEDGLTCWGSIKASPQKESKHALNPFGLVSGFRVSCVLFTDAGDDHGLRNGCWSAKGSSSGIGANLVAIFKSGFQSCYLLKDGNLSCLANHDGFHENVKVPAAPPKPYSLSVSGKNLCFAAQAGYWCSNDDPQFPRSVSGIKEIVTGHAGICAVTSPSVRCWQSYNGADISTPAELNTVGAGVGEDHVCIMGVSRIQCWGNVSEGQSSPPYTVKPRFLTTSGNHNCAIDEEGLKCWGANKYGQSTVSARYLSGVSTSQDPRFHLDRLPSFLNLAKQVSSESRGRIYAEAVQFLESNLPASDISAETSQARFLLANFLYPLVASGESEYTQQTLFPAFRESLAGFKTTLGFSDVSAVPASATKKLLALAVMKSTLSVAVDFSSSEDRLALQAPLRAIGQAMGDVRSGEKVRTALSEIEATYGILEKLSRNAKSAFLVQSIHLATTWLKGIQ